MTDEERNKIAAAAKMAFGAIRMGSAIATGLGVGVIGGALRHRHMSQVAMRLGKLGVEGGKCMFDEGLTDWKQANS
jgi:hypothetical protein